MPGPGSVGASPEGSRGLKDRLAKVVVLILVITFFQQAIQLRFMTALDLVYLALGTLLIGGTLFLSSRASKNH